jgi:hypothetical protein
MSGFIAAIAGGTPSDPGLDTQTVTAGISGTFPDRARGFSTSLSMGSVADGTSNIYAGAAIRELYHTEDGGETGADVLVLSIAGVVANSGWAAMEIAGTAPLLRTSAVFSTVGGNTYWYWYAVGNNPFGNAGTLRTVKFT